LFNTYFAFSQSASSFIKEADKLKAEKKYIEAIEKYTKALELKPNSKDAFEGRSECFILNKEFDKASNDYKYLLNMKPHNVSYIMDLADCYVNMNRVKTAIEYYQRALSEEDDNIDAYQKIVMAFIKSKDYENAQKYCTDAMIKNKESYQFFFLKGLALDSAKNYQGATMSYERAISLLEDDEKYKKLINKSDYKYYYANLAHAYAAMYRYAEAQRFYGSAIYMDKSDWQIRLDLGKVYCEKKEYSNAVAEFNDALLISDKNPEIIFNRGIAYKKLKQFFTAIQDFNTVLSIQPKNEKAFAEKALCFEELNQFENAMETYQKMKEALPENVEVIKLMKQCASKQFEANRETEKPVIKIISPATSETEALIIPVGKSYVEVKGKIVDKSRIQKITIDDLEVNYEKEQLEPVFISNVSVDGKTSLTIKAIDIYNNTQTATYNLVRKETNAPNIELIDPLATANNEIYVGQKSGNLLKIEGRVNDESFVKSLFVNGNAVSFSLSEYNPTFTIDVDITNSDSIVFIASDVFGNTSKTRFTINRKAASEAAINPMGITWVVFISNSNYVNFTSLDGPKKDKEKMKTALADYRIDRFIEKNDMTKEEMEKFFAIELRNLLKSTQVNSLLIWYAGHGKYLNDNGYWIPVNATKGEEYSYFQITNLKGYISTYKLLKHVLVVSDACETGPAFCNSDIASTDPGSCEKSDAINLTSSQVFTSSNSEQSSDISIFADSFSNILINNNLKCLSIERIKEEVTTTVNSNQKQKPKFGSITGLENKGGSFYFMKR
jgi:tetratricopeptide (TPR) repeat protein